MAGKTAGRWNTSTWNSGNYPVAQSVSPPAAETIGIFQLMPAVTDVSHAVL